MPNQKLARSGLLLILTAGPLLVFLFLYLFGKNRFEIDSYSIPLSALVNEPVAKSASGILLIPSKESIGPELARDYQNELKRISRFLESVEQKPSILEWNTGSLKPSPLADRLLSADTILEVTMAKGNGKKRLPASPRAFLFDASQNLRGVYGLCNSLSVDTLILEYKILTEQ